MVNSDKSLKEDQVVVVAGKRTGLRRLGGWDRTGLSLQKTAANFCVYSCHLDGVCKEESKEKSIMDGI